MTSRAATDDTRQRLIDAALTLFGQVGYTRATTRAIADAAGVNEVTLFRHFGKKKTCCSPVSALAIRWASPRRSTRI